MKRIIFSIVCLILTMALSAQSKRDTVMFTLHCPENEVAVEEDLQHQLDSIYEKLGFLDTTKVTIVQQALVVGFSDSKGPKRTNLVLSEKRARYVHWQIKSHNARDRDVVLGLGEAQPVADNKTAEGRAKNRRVEVTLIYEQQILPPKVPKKVYPDTIIVFEDGTTLHINLADYQNIRHCLKYERSTSLFDLFEDLAENTHDETYYNFGKISLSWCNDRCLKGDILLSIPVPDSLIRSSLKDLKAYVRQLKKKRERAALVKHKDERWYLDVSSRCVVWMPPCVIGCGRNNGTNEKMKIKKVRVVAKDGYRIIGASMGSGGYFSYKKVGMPRRKVKLNVYCLPHYPTVSVVTIRKNNADTIYYASGTEQTIAHGLFCANCKQKKKKDKREPEATVKKSAQPKEAKAVKEKKVKNRFLRKKYKFGKQDYSQKTARKITRIKPVKK